MVKIVHAALGIASAMLALVAIAAVTFALAVWAAVATVIT